MTLDTAIGALSGIGKVREAAFARLGICDVRGLLYHFPRAYQNRGDIKTAAEVHDGETAALLLTVGTPPKTVMLRGRMLMTKFSAFDASGRVSVVFFNSRYVEKSFQVGQEFRFFGKINIKNGVKTLTAPVSEPYADGVPLPPLVPVYPLTAGLTRKFVEECVRGAINGLDPGVPDPLPDFIEQKFELCGFRTALSGIHFPSDFDELRDARRYFMTCELLLFALGVSLSRGNPTSDAGEYPKLSHADVDLERFTGALPYELTGAQKRAVSEILSDMTGGSPMMRLVSGDVGSGKTVCAAAAVYFAFSGGYQSAFMAPTEILASQHYSDLAPLFEKFGMKTALLTGSTAPAKKREILSALASGELDVCIGTHALISDGVGFSRLGLAVTDEQHRFGVRQRSLLSSSGGSGLSPHVLVMSATPIPRTLALILYGELSASEIDELPPGRQKIDTFTVGESYRERLNAFIAKQVGEGLQVYVVCPAVSSKDENAADPSDEEIGAGGLYVPDSLTSPEDELLPVKNATDHAEYLRTVLPDIKIGLLHGKMKAAEKDAVMNSFAAGELGVLVSTTVIEVGVNVPNASLMIIENAERFGLSQLHQLRGRVGRGSAKSYCVLVSDSKSENALKRLKVMRETCDGYKIAKTDLELRGPGEFFPKSDGSARQHGELELKIASLCSDVDTLKAAFDCAKEITALDPELALPCHAGLRSEVARLFNLQSGTLN